MSAGPVRSRILVVGHSCLDSIAVSESRPPDDGKLEASKIWCGSGGPAANAALALTRLGHEVHLVTRFGDDAAGAIIHSTLVAEGVRLVTGPVQGGRSSLAQIRSRGPDRSVLWARGELPPLPADAATVRGWLQGMDLLYLDGHEVPAATIALEVAAGSGIPIVGDAGSLREGSADWPRRMQSVVASPRWLRARFPEAPSLESSLGDLAGLAPDGALTGVTLGASGGFALQGGELLPWTARKTGPVDTTVAGDAFHAGLADALLQGMPAAQALAWAATLGAAVCRAPGHVGLPRDRAQLQLWHGRWGFREAPDPALLARPVEVG